MNEFCQPHPKSASILSAVQDFDNLPKVPRSTQFRAILKGKANSLTCKSSSGYRLVHILPTSFSKSAPSIPFFKHLQIELSPKSCALFADNFPKSSRETADTETLPVLRRRQEPYYQKKHRVLCPRVCSPGIHKLPNYE